ncbi:hypothetical protein [Gemmatimonas sp.]|uniref:hypothetical protein n=1 Tax=Gemmatimonas sp. TaxID=1962908 RepID=UPI003983A444
MTATLANTFSMDTMISSVYALLFDLADECIQRLKEGVEFVTRVSSGHPASPKKFPAFERC